jgi:hypothetical protein
MQLPRALQLKRSPTASARPRFFGFRPCLESLEDRDVPATFMVNTLADVATGSLREAINQANLNPGPDRIDFAVTGTVQLLGALPSITDPVNIDGSTAPGFTAAPLVEVDYNGFAGLTFAPGSSGSALRSLGHVNASTAGVTLDAGQILLVGNYIGLELDGDTAAGNNGGLLIHSNANTIGIVGQPRNVISGNTGNGVTIDGGSGEGGSGNFLVENFIGTDATGLLDRGNANFGIHLTNGALFNNIGGTANKLKESTELTPGNLISGNDSDGVRIDGDTLIETRANNNFLGSNFIGTDITGVAALPNSGNGVSVIGADFNNIAGDAVGIIPLELPFRYKNVISGNLGHGLLLHDAIGTTVYANFFGLGADNQTGVGNGLDGVLINGTSMDTVYGGVIPLGNVSSDNGIHGVEIADQASGTTLFNCFSGTAAFNATALVGNGVDGIHITSTGANNVILTSEIAGNVDDGIEISGNASGVLVDKVRVGVNSAGDAPQSNGDNGIEIGGNANNNSIGGVGPSGILFSTISGNLGYGVAFLDSANNNVLFNSFIGTGSRGIQAVGNRLGGVYLGPGTSNNTIGGTKRGSGINSSDTNVISGNMGPGVILDGTTGNRVIGNLIGTRPDGMTALGNMGDGVLVTGNAGDNLIGDDSTDVGNTIAFNTADGVSVESGDGNAIRKNSIHDNTGLGIALSPGANLDQAAPTLTSAVLISGDLQVRGTLTSTPSTTFTIDLFANVTADPSGFGEGRFYLGSVQATTSAAGRANFLFTGSAPPSGATLITATATDSGGNTSEFSAPIATTSLPSAPSIAGTLFLDYDADGTQDPGEPGVAGQTIYADLNGNQRRESDEPADTTDSSGAYSLAGLPLDVIDVRADLPSGSYVFTLPASGSQPVTLTAADPSAQGIDFGVQTVTPVANPTFPDPDLFAPAAGADANTEYVQALYRSILGREADPQGLSVWLGLLPDPAAVAPLTYQQARLGVADGIWTSFEHRGLQVNAYYQDLLGRLPDPAGAGFWFSQLFYGPLTEEQVVAGILASPEYQARFPGGDTALVDGLFANVLGVTDPTSTTLTFNAGPFDPLAELQAGETLDGVVLDVVYSDQAVLRGIEGDYLAYLQRPASSASEQEFWLTVVRGSGRLRDVATGILGSQEFLGRVTGM